MSALRDRCGFTLVEILIAVAIFSLGMMGILAVFGAATESHRRAVDGAEAAMIASSVASEARARFRGAGSLVPVIDAKVEGKPRYRYDVEYVQLDDSADEVLMHIKVRWTERGRGSFLSFYTILFRKQE